MVVGRFELDFARAFDYRADTILHSLTRSLKRLRLPYADICFLQVTVLLIAKNKKLQRQKAVNMERHPNIRYSHRLLFRSMTPNLNCTSASC